MKQKAKTFLFALGIIVSVVIINAILFAIVVNSPNLILSSLGKYMWVILPVIIFLIVVIKETTTKKKISETLRSLKRGSVWAFVVMAIIMLLSYLSSLS